MSFIRALVCFAALTTIGAAGTAYHGVYRVENLEIQYDVPTSLLGPPIFTFVGRQFRDESDLGIFYTSYRKGRGGISLGLSSYPDELQARHDLTAYTKYYVDSAAKRGLCARVTVESISGIDWLRSEERYNNGNLARVIYVAPILPDFQLVCRIGLNDDLDPNAKTKWPDWMPAIVEIMKSITFSDINTKAEPKGLGLTHP